jgi:hypothetical protein
MLTIIDAISSTAGESSAGPSNEQITDGDLSTNDKAKPKRSRYKRQMSRSDPSNRIDQTDGQQDSDITAVSSGEGQAFHGSAMVKVPSSLSFYDSNTMQQRRRVSAPSDPPTAPDARGPRRRNRHWRLRNRAAEIGGSGNTSTSASGEASTDEIHGPAPPVPSPTIVVLQRRNTTPRVTFAPSHVDGNSSAS